MGLTNFSVTDRLFSINASIFSDFIYNFQLVQRHFESLRSTTLSVYRRCKVTIYKFSFYHILQLINTFRLIECRCIVYRLRTRPSLRPDAVVNCFVIFICVWRCTNLTDGLAQDTSHCDRICASPIFASFSLAFQAITERMLRDHKISFIP